MTRLHIIRHGETEWNVLKKMQGQKDSPLTSLGQLQALSVKQNLKDVIDIVYSSPSGRALETANIIVNGSNGAVQIADELMEINLGIWEGKTIDEVKKTFPKEHKNFWGHPEQFCADQAESFLELQDRSVKFVLDILKSNRGKTILLVSHTATIKVVLAHFEGRAIQNIWKPPYIGNCSHSIIEETENGKFEIVSYSGQSKW